VCNFVTATEQSNNRTKHAPFNFNFNGIYCNKTHATISWTPFVVPGNQSVLYFLFRTTNFGEDFEIVNVTNATSITILRSVLQANNESDYQLYVEASVNMDPINCSSTTKSFLKLSRNGKEIV